MVNARRGEVEAMLDGKSYRLCLTLGGLAELEHGFGDQDMLALAQRFESGRLSADDAVRIIAAGLRGGGAEVSDDEVRGMTAENGAAGFVDIVARLLSATFGGADEDGIGGAEEKEETGAVPGKPLEVQGAR